MAPSTKSFITHTGTTVNPVGAPRLHNASAQGPSIPPDIEAIQDPAHTEGQFLRDLDRASSNKAKERLARKDT